MEAQDAATAYFFKLWEWVETNLRTVVIGIIIVAIAAVVISYYFWRQSEMEVAAGKALTQLLVSTPPNSDASQLANSYLGIAADYPGTPAGGRALVLGAATLFASGNYPEAQAQFQKYVSLYPTGPFSATAALGVAASLDAQGKTDSAADTYQRVVTSYSDPNAVDAAKFALARIDAQRGKLTEAENYYQDVIRNNPNSLLGTEAAFQAMQLREKLPAPSTSNNPPASFNLSTQP